MIISKTNHFIGFFSKNKKIRIINIKLIVLLSTLFWIACSTQNTNSDNKKIFVSIVPHKYFVQKIVGNNYKVISLTKPGQNVHTFTPTTSQIAELSKCTVYFRAGTDFEHALLPQIKGISKNIKIVDLRDSINLVPIDEHGTTKHNNNITDKDLLDPHVWLSPVLAKRQARTILNTLILIDPKHSAEYTSNFNKFSLQLDSLDNELSHILSPLKGSELFVYHPAFGYFADRYGLKMIAVETGGKEPSAKTLTFLINKAKKHKTKVIFVQPQYSPKNANVIANQVGCSVVPVNPLPTDYLLEMMELGQKIKNNEN